DNQGILFESSSTRSSSAIEAMSASRERVESSAHSSFIPRQPSSGMDVGIPACLAKLLDALIC
ncbi:MAG: hypothetical protein ACRC62_34870, partial [Microcoleus sp.]